MRFDKLIDAWDPILQRSFLEAVRVMRSAVQIEQVVRMLQNGNVEAALRAVNLDPVQWRVFDKSITSAFEAGGNATLAPLPSVKQPDGLRVQFQFNIRNPAAERWLQENSAQKVVEIVDEQRIMVRDHMVAGLQAGNNPRTIALDIAGRVGPNGVRQGGVLGLTASQAAWVRNYRDELQSDNPRAALERSLRDKRFDRTVIRAAESGQPLTSDQVDTMVQAYQNRALRYRAEAVARTEAMAALHESQQQAMEQAVETGAISRDQVTFVWRTSEDDRVREAHRVMDGQEVAMGEMFTDGDGNQLEYPGDPSAPPETVINCRCWREPSVDFLANIE